MTYKNTVGQINYDEVHRSYMLALHILPYYTAMKLESTYYTSYHEYHPEPLSIWTAIFHKFRECLFNLKPMYDFNVK